MKVLFCREHKSKKIRIVQSRKKIYMFAVVNSSI